MKALATLMLFIITFTAHAEGGITLGATRVIYNEGKKQETIKITNKNERAQYLVQSWVSDSNNSNETNKSFITTPPVFALKGNSTGTIRMVALKTDGLPKDRESVFYLNVKTIPAIRKNSKEDEEVSGRLIITTKSVLKLFYRPKAIVNPDQKSMYDNVVGVIKNNKTYLKNNTPYYITATRMLIDGKAREDNFFIKPFTEEIIYNGMAKNAKFKIVNDFGGITNKIVEF